MRIGVGQSFLSDPKARAKEATDMAMGEAGVVRAQTVIVFTQASSMAEYLDVLSAIASVSGSGDIIGASANGVLTLDGEWESGPACAVLILNPEGSEEQFKSFLFKDQKNFEPDINWESLQGVRSMLCLGDPTLFNLSPYKQIQETYKVPIFGGGASAFVEDMPGAPIFYKKNCFRESGCLLGIPESLKLHLSVSYGCKALSVPLEVSKVKQNLILELAGKSAASVLERELARVLAEAKAAHANWQRPLPLLAGVMVEGHHGNALPKPHEFTVRPILGIDTVTGGILLGEGIKEGSYVTFVLREKEWAHREMVENLQAIQTDLKGKKPLFGFYFNCAGRGRDLYEDDDHDVSLIRKHLGDFPLVGMFGSFELAPQNNALAMHGFTGVLAVYTKAI